MSLNREMHLGDVPDGRPKFARCIDCGPPLVGTLPVGSTPGYVAASPFSKRFSESGNKHGREPWHCTHNPVQMQALQRGVSYKNCGRRLWWLTSTKATVRGAVQERSKLIPGSLTRGC
jgi:hypothetical protein